MAFLETIKETKGRFNTNVLAWTCLFSRVFVSFWLMWSNPQKYRHAVEITFYGQILPSSGQVYVRLWFSGWGVPETICMIIQHSLIHRSNSFSQNLWIPGIASHKCTHFNHCHKYTVTMLKHAPSCFLHIRQHVCTQLAHFPSPTSRVMCVFLGGASRFKLWPRGCLWMWPSEGNKEMRTGVSCCCCCSH